MEIISKILFWIIPKNCPFCDDILSSDATICSKCVDKIKYIHHPKCFKCGKPLDEDEKEYCYDCLKKHHSYEKGLASFLYNDLVKKSIYRFKYENRKQYAKSYANLIVAEYSEEIARWGCDVIIPVPIHKNKLISRGYNQSLYLAKHLSEYLGIPADGDVLTRIVDTIPQKELEVSRRRTNVENAFKITKNVVEYKKIILVDDIYTTGSTIDACAEVLLNYGVEKVYFISLSIGAGI